MAKKFEREILITGFGGQGIVLAGNIMGAAATLHDLKHATMTQSYGPEARGGSCSAQVVISDDEIMFPYVEHPQDTDLVTAAETDQGCVAFDVPATRFAEELGNKMMANIVMLGFFSAVCDAVSADSLRSSVLDSVPPKTKEKNGRAFDRGREYGEEILKSRAKQDRVRGE
jgi:2-oxoglutarate ferredoxin oxidoreductase subunit gamma